MIRFAAIATLLFIASPAPAAVFEVDPDGTMVRLDTPVAPTSVPARVRTTRAASIMQLMPGTARAMGVEPFDPAANIRGGTAYLRLLLNRFDGDVVRTVAAYNAGPSAVIRAGGVPRIPETVSYVAAVMDRLAAAAQ